MNSDKYVDSFLLPSSNGVNKEDYEILKNALAERGFGEAQHGKDGYGFPILLLAGTLLRCRKQHFEDFAEGENHFLTINTLYYNATLLAQHTELDGDSSFKIDKDALNSLPKNLVPSVCVAETTTQVGVADNISSSSITSSVSRRAFVAVQKKEPDYNAPDGSEITYLIKGQAGDFGDLCNCKLPPSKTPTAVKHQTVQELWNFTAGNGEFWLKDGEIETVHEVKKGTSILIYPGVSFQFRNMSEDTILESTITTMPPWPGPNEAAKVEGKWPPSVIQTKETVRSASPSEVKSTLFGNSVSTSTADAIENTANTQNSMTGNNTK